MEESLTNNFDRSDADHPRNTPLARISRDMPNLINEVVHRTCSEYTGPNSRETSKTIEEAITDSIFWERKRLEMGGDPMHDPNDRGFWQEINSALLRTVKPADSNGASTSKLLERIVRYHAEEIAGNFNENVYRVATVAVPHGLSWLLQALSWKSFRSLFSERLDLRRKIHLVGQVDQIRKLSKKGTVILIPTHFSNIDSVLIGWVIYELGLPPFCYGAGLNLFTNPLFGYFMNNLGAYKVDRKKRHGLYKKTLKNYSTVILEHGCHSLFFPGGGRSRSGGLETNLKLGLLGTTVDAYVNNLVNNKPNPNFYVVPCVTSYHFVLEAATLIGDYLSEKGQSRFIIEDDESSRPKEVFQFLLKFFKASSSMYVNIGRALDPFGNFVDDDGYSLSPHGRRLHAADFVKSGGSVCHAPQRDREYTRLLGEKIVQRYRSENIALSSHFIAYAYFEYLRRRYGTGNLFRVFRLDEDETLVPYNDFAAYAGPLLSRLHELYRQGKLYLEPALRSTELRNIVDSAQRNMGVFHSRRPLKLVSGLAGDMLACEDVKLLYYYHNRMAGYALDVQEGQV